ncbi:acyltransferase [Thalassolituus marinus]|uniref:Acyltransferase n=1 Tax=Thalassolituus marinus TaxID=671053 RepID=A0ABS7ZQH0_9GAMM|nr:acyltransferase [Thalassolituus marinus]MCA6063942.1 acyltransferase [Thalassolituus marinus]
MLPLIRGSVAAVLLVTNVLFWCLLLFAFTLLKIIIPVPAVRSGITRILNAIANSWISCNSGWMHLTQKMDWDIQLPPNLDSKGWYFVISNHQSWVDILVLQHSLNRRIPLLKFFLKQELIKVPVMGAAWWALDFPFMKRYSKAYLEKYPEKKGQDLETTRKACEKFRTLPTSVMNFLEGTRFEQAKHDKQQSPYKHLLKPKAGGMAFAMSAMGEQFSSVLDVTIHYPDFVPTFWEFMQGKMPRCTVLVEELPIPQDLRNGDYENDADYRSRFQQWVHELWEKKDAQLDALIQKG